MIKVMIKVMTLIMINNTPFFKSVIFNCFQFKKSEHHLDCDCIFAVFSNLYPNRFGFISEPHDLVRRSVWSILHTSVGSIFYIFSKIFKIWNQVFIFFRFQTQENRFWGPVTFLLVFHVQKIINAFTILAIFYKFSPMLRKSFSYVCFRQYGINRFSKTILKQSI